MDKLFEAIASNIIVFGAFLVPIGIVAVTSYFRISAWKWSSGTYGGT